MARDVFGTLDGEDVLRHRISGGGLTADILSWGAVIQDLRLDGHEPPLILGFDRIEDYATHINYFGAIAGRYANRIAGGRLVIDGRPYQIDRNDNGNALHGGGDGIFRRQWAFRDAGPDFVTLAFRDPDGSNGFPGTLDIACTYSVGEGGALAVAFEATTDAPTVCNLAQHAYFNLDDGGTGSALDHLMTIAAGAYLPVDGVAIPTGVVRPVDNTVFDFRAPRPVRLEIEGRPVFYDHNFCLAAERGQFRRAAWVKGAASGVEMEIWTTEPGLQFYDGSFLEDGLGGLDGRAYVKNGGFCLEAQVWPDSPNRPYFPQALLRPGETYRQRTEYRFRKR